MIQNFQESGVAEIVGALMLIAVIALGVSIAGLYLLSNPVPEKIPEFQTSLSNNSTNLFLHHDGGDSIPLSGFKILVNGNPTDKRSSGSSSDWSIGDTLTLIGYTYNPTTPLPDVKIVYTGPAGDRVLADYISSDSQYVPTSAPTVTGITPSSGTQGSSVSISNLVGTNFRTGATVKLTRSGSSDIAGTSVSVVSSTQITCNFTLVGATVGNWNVVVTNTDDVQSGSLSNGFTVTGNAPTLASITPSSGPTSGGTAVTIVGTNFVSGGSFGVKIGGASAPSVTWVNSTHITAVTPAGTAGTQNVVITNNDGQTATGTYTYFAVYQGFTVEAWVKWNINPNPGSATTREYATIVVDGNTDPNSRYHLQHNRTNTNFEFAANTSSRKYVWSTTTPVANTWYYVVGVYNQTTVSGNNLLRIHVNGTQEKTVSIPVGDLKASPNNKQIGGPSGIIWQSSQGQRKFDGEIRGLNTYERAMSPAEVAFRFGAGLPSV